LLKKSQDTNTTDYCSNNKEVEISDIAPKHISYCIPKLQCHQRISQLQKVTIILTVAISVPIVSWKEISQETTAKSFMRS